MCVSISQLQRMGYVLWCSQPIETQQDLCMQTFAAWLQAVLQLMTSTIVHEGRSASHRAPACHRPDRLQLDRHNDHDQRRSI